MIIITIIIIIVHLYGAISIASEALVLSVS